MVPCAQCTQTALVVRGDVVLDRIVIVLCCIRSHKCIFMCTNVDIGNCAQQHAEEIHLGIWN